jgi:hypothetical protein
MLQKIKKYDCCDNIDETGLFFNLQHRECPTFHGDSHHGGKFKKAFTVLHVFNDDDSDITITIGSLIITHQQMH